MNQDQADQAQRMLGNGEGEGDGVELKSEVHPGSIEETVVELPFPSPEDERCKALVCVIAARLALGQNSALFDPMAVRGVFDACKAAYDLVEFRRDNRDAISTIARNMARRYGQAPDLMVSTEAPVPCRIEGMGPLYFFNESRLLPIWRLFEPAAIGRLHREHLDRLAEAGNMAT
jgi:hypothetical protein